MGELLTKDTIIKTNLVTVIAVIGVIVGAFVSYTVAVNRIGVAEKNLIDLDQRVDSLESSNIDTQKLLVEIHTDVKTIKARQ